MGKRLGVAQGDKGCWRTPVRQLFGQVGSGPLLGGAVFASRACNMVCALPWGR